MHLISSSAFSCDHGCQMSKSVARASEIQEKRRENLRYNMVVIFICYKPMVVLSYKFFELTCVDKLFQFHFESFMHPLIWAHFQAKKPKMGSGKKCRHNQDLQPK